MEYLLFEYNVAVFNSRNSGRLNIELVYEKQIGHASGGKNKPQ